MCSITCALVSPSQIREVGLTVHHGKVVGGVDYGCPGCPLISGNVVCLCCSLMAYGACYGGLDRMYGLGFEQYGFLNI